MTKFVGTKLKMYQIWKDDKAIGVTPVKLDNGADLTSLKVGDLVKASGISKGHGFQGVVKRHGFSGGPKTHGQKNRHRAPGSIGNTTPQRVLPGRRMAGHMGVERVTIKNLEIVDINNDQRILFLKGAVTGNEGGRVEIYS
ncbi:MAG: 50S ribosomal protein L3 [Candidatus Harrisonbacteria bacterium RIFCSPHIGHO2_01_FULL_44_13]|uniref:Large ribosomal subunit protein uL3 n=1 Tax=Candidatus Harrisonbacteria bacterium RIFCSPLOWO2_01_FULL_44_18 TaxID=1798407 RepID=A0A1G1ZMZ2_9BACT|nr:MAG: 50S ribosomal protein L3 [Candidatus Harrisonbacteria bacterium RIFCSPHIGHO2_01_FULL_44_13]OGY65944.1 MAG: 50S ribosomal protein L3 [Candidatus Harrisonbacteria bacterium RIFCSPLOWO2_01_FULL_44_18]